MSPEALLISIVGALLVVIQTLVVWIFKSTNEDLKAQVARQRDEFEEYRKTKERFDYEFRHDEYSPKITSLEFRMGALEGQGMRVEQLWKKIFNGHKP